MADNKIVAMLQESNETLAKSEASSPGQGTWPPDGDRECVLTGIDVASGTFREKVEGSNDPKEHDCISITFHYDYIKDQSAPDYDASDPTLSFNGETFQLVPNFEKTIVNSGSQTRARINWERFKSHASKILGKEPAEIVDTGAALKAMTEVAEADNKTVLLLRIKSRKAGSATYRTEHIVENMSLA